MTSEEQNFMGKMDSFIGALTELVNKTNATANTSTASSSTRLKLPDSYDGTRDAVMIDRWIGAVERHKRFHDWDETRTMQFASTLLSGDADTWYRATEINTDEAPKSWLEFKRLLIEAFKPPNAKTLARERLRTCVQTSTIQQYVNEFQNVKLSLPDITEDEACDRFVSGLVDDQLVAQIHDVDEDELTLRMAFNMALSYEAARRPRVLAPTPMALASPRYHPVMQHQVPNRITSSLTPAMVDDPMDLDSMQSRGYTVEGCFYCGMVGHIRENCFERLRDIKAMEQQRYNNLVRNGSGQQQQQGGTGNYSGNGAPRGGRGGRGGGRSRGRGGYRGSYRGVRGRRRGVSYANTTEILDDTTIGGGQLQQDQQDF